MGLFSSSKPKVAKLQMKPTTVTTGFGTGSYDPSTGNVGYTLDDQLAQFRDMFYGAAEGMAPTAEQTAFAKQVGDYGTGLFNRAANLDVNKLTSDYYNQQQALLQPSRAQEDVRMADTLFKSGRTGAGIGTYGGGGYINPEQFSKIYAREQADAQSLLGAEDRARNIQNQDLSKAMGYLDSANALSMRPYSNINSLFGMGSDVEKLGYNTLNTVGQFAPIQYGWQTAQQANQQAQNNAKASGGFMGGLGGGLLGGIANAGLNYMTGGIGTGLAQGIGGGMFGNIGTNPFSSWTSSLFSRPLTGNSNVSPGINLAGYY